MERERRGLVDSSRGRGKRRWGLVAGPRCRRHGALRCRPELMSAITSSLISLISFSTRLSVHTYNISKLKIQCEKVNNAPPHEL